MSPSRQVRGCYAVKVRARREIGISEALRLKGYDSLLPTYVQRKRYSDRIKRITSALFPGYVFVRLDADQTLPVASTDGVSYIVRSGSALLPLPEEEVSTIEALCGNPANCEPCNQVPIGQHVRVESGPLRGLSGTLVRSEGSQRLVISINPVFNSVSVDIRDLVIVPVA